MLDDVVAADEVQRADDDEIAPAVAQAVARAASTHAALRFVTSVS